MSQSTLTTNYCHRCETEFRSRTEHPNYCSLCKSKYWHTPRATQRAFHKPLRPQTYVMPPIAPEVLAEMAQASARSKAQDAARQAAQNDGRRRIGGVILNPLDEMFNAAQARQT